RRWLHARHRLLRSVAAGDPGNTSVWRCHRTKKWSASRRSLVVQEASEFSRPARVLQFPQRLGLDLADALAGDRELLADFFQRVVGVHANAEAHAEHALLARGQ